MLQLAVRNYAFLEVDDREVRRAGKSYTVETLGELRNELGASQPLIFVLGADAFALLHEWNNWKALFDLSHLVVLDRPGLRATVTKELASFSTERLVDNPLCLHSKPSGMICRLTLTPMDISSTNVRALFRQGKSTEHMVPTEVVSYIQEHRLYGAASQ